MHVDEAGKLMCPFGQNCITCECMAWRWNCEDTSIVIGETIGGEKIRTKGERAMSTTDGYCGLAGKEGAE